MTTVPVSEVMPSAERPDFQAYQRQFTAYLRNPKINKPPKGVPAGRMRVYAEIVFDNLESSISACYPVCKKVLGQRAWLKLVRAFLSEYSSTTPIFREIPEQFLDYLSTCDAVPAYLPQLAHYEWIELAVSTSTATLQGQLNEKPQPDSQGDLLQGIPVLNPSLQLLSYDYPVHRISPRRKPSMSLAQPVHFLVYRNAGFEVKFIEINLMTAQLLHLLQTGEYTGQQALLELAKALAHPEPQALIGFGAEILADLKAKEVILGVVALA